MGVKGSVDQNANEFFWISRKPKVLIFDEPTRGITLEQDTQFIKL